MGFHLSIKRDGFFDSTTTFELLIRGTLAYKIDLGTDAFGNITRINNALADLPKRLENAKAQLDTLLNQQEETKLELEKPFALTDELAAKEIRLALLNADLNIEGNGGMDVDNDPDRRDETGAAVINLSYERDSVPAKSAKPTMMDNLRAFQAAGTQDSPRENPGRKSADRDI
jgi:hypothetical protein